jgi:hypothetical protein
MKRNRALLGIALNKRFRLQPSPPPKWLRSKSLIHLLTYLACFAAISGLASEKYPIDAPLEGPPSVYTPLMIDLLKNWPPQDVDFSKPLPQPVMARAYQTPGNGFYIGAVQWMKIDAPLVRVEAALDAFEQYQQIFPDYKDIHVVSRDDNKILTSWEQRVPFFLAPNVKYTMIYLVDKSSPIRKVYRYKLEASKDLKVDDGVIVIEADGANSTRYTEYDFFDANWGIAKTLAPGRIWKDSIGGLIVSDYGIKFKAEHPDWANSKVLKESEDQLDHYPLEDLLKDKERFPLLKKP